LWLTQGLCYLHFLRPLHGRRLVRNLLRAQPDAIRRS
jgi:hypothetical protein